jgi:NAD(P)-dependent dehydrogenase (short-subunit alcohol dehydrogenase family)
VNDPLVDPFADAGPGWMAGRTALVTGGGQNGELPGVGYATAVVLAGHGARVAVVDRDLGAAQRTVERIEKVGGEAHAVVADVTDDADCGRAVAAVVERFGALDALMNNVAVGDRAGLFEVSPDRWDELVSINLKSAWQVTRHAVPVLPEGSAIVNVSSVGVSARGPGMVYNVAKAGLENLTVGAAATLGAQGIRVNTVQVGAIWGAFAARNMAVDMRELRRRGIGLGIEGTSWDIAQATLFLLSDRARWVSGHTLTVEGGPPRRFPPGPPVREVVR